MTGDRWFSLKGLGIAVFGAWLHLVNIKSSVMERSRTDLDDDIDTMVNVGYLRL